MKKIDFDKVKPTFTNGDFNWYIDEVFQNYIQTQQADNLPNLKGIGCFIVKNDKIEDYVLIDNKQNVIAAYPYNQNGYEQMTAKINIIKISKHFEEHELVK
jgi:hypothetical protein